MHTAYASVFPPHIVKEASYEGEVYTTTLLCSLSVCLSVYLMIHSLIHSSVRANSE